MSDDLNALAAEAAALDSQDNQVALIGQSRQEQEAPQSLNQAYKPKLVEFLTYGVVGAAHLAPKLPIRDHITGESINMIADAAVKVADVEGWDLQKLLGDNNSRIGAWISLLVAAGFPVFTLYMAIKSQKVEKEIPASEVVNVATPTTEEMAKGFHA